MRSSTSHQFNLSEQHDLLTERLGGRARTSMAGFVKKTMPDFYFNWHHNVICKYLDKFVNGDITRLMIFVEPQTGKSELVSRHLPAYILGRDPEHKVISATYGDAFAGLFNLDVQRIIDTPNYYSIFPNTRLAGHGEEGKWMRNSSTFDVVGHRGRYNSVGVGGSLTGRTGNTLIIDDPVKNEEEARSPTFQERQFRWYTTVARTRLKKDSLGRPPRVLLTMTRWNVNDLAGRLLAIAKANKDNPNFPQWTVLKFPAVRDNMDDVLDPRKLEQPLWPENKPMSELEEIRATDRRTWSSLYMQNPTPAEGNIVQRGWWKYYKELPELDFMIQSWDLTFKKGRNTDFVVGQVWGRKGANKYLLDQVRARMGFNDQLKAIVTLSGKWPLAVGKYIEQAANAEALLETLRDHVPGLILVPAKTSKRSRAEAVSPQIQAGNVWLPDPSIAPWVHDFVEEWATFTGDDDDHDDQVDAGSQGIKKLSDPTFNDWSPISMKKVSTWNR